MNTKKRIVERVSKNLNKKKPKKKKGSSPTKPPKSIKGRKRRNKSIADQY